MVHIKKILKKKKKRKHACLGLKWVRGRANSNTHIFHTTSMRRTADLFTID